MKSMIYSALVITLFTSNVFAGVLFKKTYKLQDESNKKARIVETFRAATGDEKSNALKALIKKISVQYEDVGTISDVTEKDIFVLETGKGSASTYGSEALVGLPASMLGTGMIENYATYFKVYHSVDMSTEVETVVISSQAEIKDVK